jgi:hypothetical protein
MVPNLIWAPDFFGPQEIWSPHKNHHMAFSCGAQTSWAQISQGPKKSGAQMRPGPISGIAPQLPTK